MPRGKKNETEIETSVMPTDNAEEAVEEQAIAEQTTEDEVATTEEAAEEQTTSVSDGLEDSTEVANETETVETPTPVTTEDPNESAAEDKDSESTSTDESAQVTEESEGSAETAEKKEEAAPKLTMLKGNFKVYRGRNLATITAMTAAVVPSGDVIVENDVKWLPVIFTSKSGKVASGFIVVK